MLTAHPSCTTATRSRCSVAPSSRGSPLRAFCPGSAPAGPGPGNSWPRGSYAPWRGGPRHPCVRRSRARCGASWPMATLTGCCSRRAVCSSPRSSTRCGWDPWAGGCSSLRAGGRSGAGCPQPRRIRLATAAWPGCSPHGGRELLASARLKIQITFSVARGPLPAELCSGFRVYSAGDDHVLPVNGLAVMRPGGRG